MNTAEQHTLNTEAAARRFVLRTDPAPALGSGSMAADQDRTFSMLAHLFPLIIWLWKRKESPAVDVHGKEALNFGITMLICIWPVSFIAGLLGSAVATIVGIALMVVWLGVLALVIFGMLKVRDGQVLRYPVNFRLIK